MHRPRILLVEDEENLAHGLRLNLNLENYDTTLATSGKDAAAEIDSGIAGFSLVILDVMLPDINGFELCRRIRERSDVPVLMLTARSDKQSTVEGLKLGADDYLAKPFDLDELLLRVKNLIRRRPSTDAVSRFTFGNCEVNFSTYEIIAVNAERITLSRRETALLQLLTSSAGQVVSRDTIIEKLWRADENPSTRTIDNYILGFRKYFETDPRNPRHFHTIRGVGYKFTP